MFFYVWLATLFTVLFLYLQHIYSRFKRCGVKYFTPVPLIGSMNKMIFRINHFSDDIQQTYDAFPGERFVGRFEFTSPVVVVRDIELIKQITIKDFEHFLDHRIQIDGNNDPIFGRTLFALKGQEWKDMRSTMSPAFTSSKIKNMVPFMVEVGDIMVKSLKDKIAQSKDSYMDIDTMELMHKYANDVIASCAFGLKTDSYSSQDNEFFLKSREASSFNFRQMLVFFGLASMPKVLNYFKISIFTESSKQFFRTLVLSTMRDRELYNIIRPDMIHLLMEAKKGQLIHDNYGTTKTDETAGFATVEESDAVGKKKINRVWADDDLIAQAVLFFIAGFETVSSSMSLLLHELAVNPEVQEKLFKEIKELDDKSKGSFDYNSIQSLTYLDMVVSETLRLWPAAIALDRYCTKDYNLGKPNDKAKEDYIVRKGEGLYIPVWAFHRNPDFFPDPLKFDPERFSEQNKHNINPFTYMPFGMGPRNCIGSRFALCEIKAMTYQLLRSMEVSPAAKTQIPIVLDRSTFNLRIRGGHWLRFRNRE